jgi:hypothetical protein
LKKWRNELHGKMQLSDITWTPSGMLNWPPSSSMPLLQCFRTIWTTQTTVGTHPLSQYHPNQGQSKTGELMMSEDELKNLPSLQGYINIEELKSTLLKAFGTGSVSALILTILTVILENLGRIYVGPAATIVISVASALAALIKAHQVGMKYLQEGK